MMKENVDNEFNKHDMNQQSVISQIHQNKITIDSISFATFYSKSMSNSSSTSSDCSP